MAATAQSFSVNLKASMFFISLSILHLLTVVSECFFFHYDSSTVREHSQGVCDIYSVNMLDYVAHISLRISMLDCIIVVFIIIFH